MGSSLGEIGQATAPDPNAVYSLGSIATESERLQRQADEWAPESTAVIDRIGLRPGDSAVDIGCGPSGVLELLHRRVSPGGRVVGVDSAAAHVEMASKLALERGLDGVEIVAGDARDTGLPADSFDLVHARALLVNVPAPEEVVAEMVRLAKPGGWVAGLEPEPDVSICYPRHAAVDRLIEIFDGAFTRNGSDSQIGRRMCELYRDAGLVDVVVDIRAAAYALGHSRRTIRADLVQAMKPQILELGLSTEVELDQLDVAAREHLANPEVVVMPHLNVLAWGRKPAAV
jgi:ubiquinone/menaquinone biosynthesis C-methylase UbiE